MVSRKRSLDALIEDIEKWIGVGQEAVGGMSIDAFSATGLTFHAGSWCIVCVGEAAGQILKHYPDFPDQYLREELLLANAARNRIAHGYYDLDEDQVWKTLKVSFTMLSEKLASRKDRNVR